jgi:DNA-directed RNA polymerase II subunit RPB2
MTIGQLVECVFGKACLANGAFGNCTAFETNGPNHELYGKLLNDAGFHSSGTQILYNGMTGEQIESNIYIGPTYYMRLKHMVKDKINYRSNDGPNTMLTRQPVQGRANDGGLRIGEMERDAIMSHGMTSFLSDSFLKRADEYYMAVCNKTGMIAVYNPEEDIFFSPSADGPGQFGEIEGKPIKQISRFGRSFSMVRVPYSFKQLIQELQVLNVQMRLITDDNVDNLLNMTESNNINKLLKIKTDSTDLSYLLKAHLENQTKRVNGEIEMKPMVTQIEELKKVAPIVQVREPPKINAPVDQNQVVEIDWNDMPENNKQTTWNVPSQWNAPSQTGWNAPPQWNAQPQPQPIVIEKEKEKEEDIKEVDFSIPQIVPILPKKQEEEILPEGWTKQISKKHNKPYYYNETTKKSVWKFEDIPVPKQTILTTIEEGEEESKVEEKNETRTIQASNI